MKIKHVVTSVALSLALGFGAVAGLMANKEAKVAKADSPKTWMSMFSVDMSGILEGDMDSIENVRVHVWGTNIDETHTLHPSGEENVYTVMASFTDAQSITGGQFVFDQIGGQYPGNDKYSEDMTFTLNNESTNPDIFCTSVNTWTDSKWGVMKTSQYEAFSWVAGVQKTYDRDPVNCTMSLKELELAANTVVESRVIRGDTSNATSSIVTVSSLTNISEMQIHYFTISKAGTYDFLVNNYYFDGGIFDVKKREVAVDYIYYVTQSGEESPDFIYSFGHDQHFGAWPGTRISKEDTVTAYFADSADFKYHGSDGNTFNRVVYKIPVLVGYPADTSVIFHNNKGAQTENLDLVGGHAYFWTNVGGWHTDNDAKALDVIIEAEELRIGATSSSVCNISKSDAIQVYTKYLGLTEYQKGLVDGSAVYTYSDEEKQSTEFKDVSYGKVMERIGIIAEMVDNPNNAYYGSITSVENNTIIVVISIAAVSAIAFTTLLVFKKKKQK